MFGIVLLRPIKPRRSPYPEEVMKAIKDEAQKITNAVAQDYAGTCRNWDHEVPIRKYTRVTKDQAYSSVTISDKIYIAVDQGTRPHDIRPRLGGAARLSLRIPGEFTPRTRPGSLASGPRFYGGRTFLRPYARHPGIAPRNFSGRINAEWARKYSKLIYNAVRRGLYRARQKGKVY